VTATDAAAARKEQQAQDLARAQEAGWNNPVPFQYDTVVGGTPAEDDTRDTAVWLSDAAIYQWDDEFGDVGEPNPELEKMLFADQYLQRAGGAIKALSFDVALSGPTKISPVRNVSHCNLSLKVFAHSIANFCQFEDAGLHPIMLDNVKLCQYKFPTPIQSYCIPAILTGHDVVAVAQTGKSPRPHSLCFLLTLPRFRQDCCVPPSDPVQAHGQGPSTRCSTPEPGPLQPSHRQSPCGAARPGRLPYA